MQIENLLFFIFRLKKLSILPSAMIFKQNDEFCVSILFRPKRIEVFAPSKSFLHGKQVNW